MSKTHRFRVTVDFTEAERDALQLLCDAEIRPPAEQLRWMVAQEALERGLIQPHHSVAQPESSAPTNTSG